MKESAELEQRSSCGRVARLEIVEARSTAIETHQTGQAAGAAKEEQAAATITESLRAIMVMMMVMLDTYGSSTSTERERGGGAAEGEPLFFDSMTNDACKRDVTCSRAEAAATSGLPSCLSRLLSCRLLYFYLVYPLHSHHRRRRLLSSSCSSSF